MTSAPAAPATFADQIAAHYGMDTPGLYLHVTGQPIWLDHGAPGQRTAARKFDAFLADCRARLLAAAAARS